MQGFQKDPRRFDAVALIGVDFSVLGITTKTYFTDISTLHLATRRHEFPVNLVIDYKDSLKDNVDFKTCVIKGRHYYINIYINVCRFENLPIWARQNISLVVWDQVNYPEIQLGACCGKLIVYDNRNQQAHCLKHDYKKLPSNLKYELIEMWGIPPGIDPRPVFNRGGPHYHELSDWVLANGATL